MTLVNSHHSEPMARSSVLAVDSIRNQMMLTIAQTIQENHDVDWVIEHVVTNLNTHFYPRWVVYSKTRAESAHQQLMNSDPSSRENNGQGGQAIAHDLIAHDSICVLEIPLKHHNQLLGIFHLLAPHSEQWSDAEINIISDLAQIVSLTLVTEKLQHECDWAEASLRQFELSLRSLFQFIPIMLHVTDCTDRIIEVSNTWLQHLGYDRREVIGKRLVDFMTHESRCYAETTILSTYFKTGTCQDIPFKLMTKQGRVLDMLFSGTVERDERGTVTRCIETLANVTRQREVERQLFREKERAQVTLHSIGDAVITTDVNSCVDYLNPTAETLTGWRVQEAKGRPISDVMPIIHEMTRAPMTNPVEQVLLLRRRVELANHAVLINRFGEEYAIQDSAAPILGSDGTLLGVVLAFHDVTQTRLMERQLAWQASHDALTGLMNRREFERKLAEAIAQAHRDQQNHVLCYLDLDRFKVINDSYGHAAGDELIRQVAILLRNHLSSSDIVARLGGDEFGIILYHCDLTQAQAISNTIRKSIQDFRFMWQTHYSTIRASIGLVQIDVDSTDLTHVMSAADAVCYAAKKRGRNRVYPYHENDAEVAQQRAERQWIERLNRALETDRFQLYAQTIQLTAPSEHPSIHLHEILLRLVNERGELVLPLNFMPAAEQYSLMPDIDQWVIRKFFQSYENQEGVCLRTKSLRNCLFTINLSGASVNDDQFLNFLKVQFDTFQVPPQSICFEITERVAIANLEKAAQLIRDIKHIGCHFALDDFGSGVSSFSYLRHLPIDYLKIDGNFVRSLLSDPVNCAIVESVNHIGHLMGIQTIAEFVETSAVRERLEVMGIDYVQGFAVHRPVPLAELH